MTLPTFIAARRRCIALLVGALVFTAPSFAATLDEQRGELLTAFAAAERGQFEARDAARLEQHPVLPWLDASAAKYNMSRAKAANINAVLTRHGQQPAMDWLRKLWLQELARRKDWANFRSFYRGSDSPELRCADLSARQDAAAIDADWLADARALWLSASSLPAACDAPFIALEQGQHIDVDLRWQRIVLAANAQQTGLMRFLAGRLPAAEAIQARAYADFLDAPSAAARSWPHDQRSQAMAVLGLKRLAGSSPDRAEALLATLSTALAFNEAQRGQVLYDIALWTVASYLPGSAARLNAVPAASFDARLHEWRAREAMSRSDDASALRAIEAMQDEQRSDPRWAYFEARLRERQGDNTAAQTLYRAAANTATFHGFLAADRLPAGSQQNYALCPLQPSQDPALRQRITNHPGVQRAIELFRINRPGLANLEWTTLLTELSTDERYVAIELAQAAHWYDRAVFGIGTEPDDLRQYQLRFPLHHERTLRREAKKHRLDPAWVAGLTRAESIFMPMARSHADARGLMQMLPGTGALTAQRLGLEWNGGGSLYRPETSLALGTAHLRYELDKQGGLPYLAIAAYNAGPTPVARWQQARAGMDADFWIETVTYKETRDYIARVLAFSVIYDWRMSGRATPLSQRLLGRIVADSAKRDFYCPTSSTKSAP